jgi:hypothetical protein
VATKYLPNYLAQRRLMTRNNAGLISFNVLRSAFSQQVINGELKSEVQHPGFQ